MKKRIAHICRAIAQRLETLHMGTKLRLFFVVVCAIPCLAAGIFAVISSGDLLLAQREEAVLRMNTQARVIFANAATVCVNVSGRLLFDAELCTLLRLSPEEASRTVLSSPTVSNLLRNYPAIESIEIYTSNPGLAGRGHFLPIDEEVKNSTWYSFAANSKGVIRWYVLDRGGSRRLCLVRKIPLGGGEFAVMVLTLSNAYLRLQLADSEMLTSLYWEGKPFYGSGELPVGSGQDAQIQIFRGEEMLVRQSEVHIAQSVERFAVVTADPGAPGTLRGTRLRLAGILCLPMLAALLVVWAYSYRLGRRVTALRNQMRSIAEGGTGISETVTGSDELGQLFWDMARTVRILQDLNRKVYEKELRYQKLLSYQSEIEYKMLASQIHPHFLFNTLESIRMQAVVNRDREVADAVHRLGQIMRRLLSASQSTVTLRDELDLVRDDLEIQQFRHVERSAYEIRADADTESLEILPLLLLPLVENAVIHGLDEKRGRGMIWVEAQREGGVLRLCVRDNGAGMEEAQRQALLRRLKSGEPRPDGRNIGLYNVDQRIRLQYGADYGVSIQSWPGKGTQVDLRLPARTGRES